MTPLKALNTYDARNGLYDYSLSNNFILTIVLALSKDARRDADKSPMAYVDWATVFRDG